MVLDLSSPAVSAMGGGYFATVSRDDGTYKAQQNTPKHVSRQTNVALPARQPSTERTRV